MNTANQTQKNNPKKVNKPVMTKKTVSRVNSSANDRLWVLILFLFAFALYANTIPNKYVLDDHGLITDNFVVKRGIQGIPVIFQTPYRYGNSFLSDNLYRPLSLVMFAVEW